VVFYSCPQICWPVLPLCRPIAYNIINNLLIKRAQRNVFFSRSSRDFREKRLNKNFVDTFLTFYRIFFKKFTKWRVDDFCGVGICLYCKVCVAQRPVEWKSTSTSGRTWSSFVSNPPRMLAVDVLFFIRKCWAISLRHCMQYQTLIIHTATAWNVWHSCGSVYIPYGTVSAGAGAYL